MLVGALVVQVRSDLGAKYSDLGAQAHENPPLIYKASRIQEDTAVQYNRLGVLAPPRAMLQNKGLDEWGWRMKGQQWDRGLEHMSALQHSGAILGSTKDGGTGGKIAGIRERWRAGGKVGYRRESGGTGGRECGGMGGNVGVQE